MDGMLCDIDRRPLGTWGCSIFTSGFKVLANFGHHIRIADGKMAPEPVFGLLGAGGEDELFYYAGREFIEPLHLLEVNRLSSVEDGTELLEFLEDLTKIIFHKSQFFPEITDSQQ